MAFPNPHRVITVSPREKVVVWSMEVPSGMVAFIDKLYVPYHPNLKITMRIDSTERIIERQIGEVNKPEEYDPPIVSEGIIEITAENVGTTTMTVEVVCDGYLIPID